LTVIKNIVSQYVPLTKCYSSNKIKKIGIGGACGTQGEKRTGYRCLVGESEVKRQLGSPRSEWESNVKMNILKIGWERGMDLSGAE
jgi:hypothetical protein